MNYDPKTLLTPTHRITLDVGVAYINYREDVRLLDGNLPSPDRIWKQEKLTVEVYQNDGVLYRHVMALCANKFPDSVGAFLLPYSWETAARIAPDPVFPDDICGCMLGLGGGIYQPDVLLDIRFGIADKYRPEFGYGLWFDRLRTVQACSDRDDLDLAYLSRTSLSDSVGVFIVEKLWDKARKIVYNYAQQNYDIGPNAGLSKDHQPTHNH